MDTRPIYKKQCKAAFGDIGFIFNAGPPVLLIVDNDELLVSCAKIKEGITKAHGGLFKIHGQLYRQDQLQELPGEFLNSTVMLFSKWYIREADKSGIFKTPEQFWLGFIMEIKFGKTWDSDKEQWVKEG